MTRILLAGLSTLIVVCAAVAQTPSNTPPESLKTKAMESHSDTVMVFRVDASN